MFVLPPTPLAPKHCLATIQRSGGRIDAFYHLWAAPVSWRRGLESDMTMGFHQEN